MKLLVATCFIMLFLGSNIFAEVEEDCTSYPTLVAVLIPNEGVKVEMQYVDSKGQVTGYDKGTKSKNSRLPLICYEDENGIATQEPDGSYSGEPLGGVSLKVGKISTGNNIVKVVGTKGIATYRMNLLIYSRINNVVSNNGYDIENGLIAEGKSRDYLVTVNEGAAENSIITPVVSPNNAQDDIDACKTMNKIKNATYAQTLKDRFQQAQAQIADHQPIKAKEILEGLIKDIQHAGVKIAPPCNKILEDDTRAILLSMRPKPGTPAQKESAKPVKVLKVEKKSETKKDAKDKKGSGK